MTNAQLDVAPGGDDTTPPPTQVQKLLAEFIGTAVLVLIGCGVAVTNQGTVITTGLAFGLTVTVLAYAFGRVSGGHFNPAVSIGAALSGRVAWAEAGLYIAAQFVGAIVGALLLMIFALGVDGFSAFDASTPLGTNGFSAGNYDYAVWAAFLVELVMTFIFVFVILAVTDQRNRAVAAIAPLAIGLTLAVIHFALIPLTGTSVNPARSFGPALFSGGDWLLQLWPFIIAPALGGAVAGVVYPLVFGRDREPVVGSGLSVGGGGSSSPGFTEQWNQGQQPWGAQGGVPQQQNPVTPAYGQPAQQGYAQPAAQDYGQQAPAAEQPIIQDGWQWDPNAQQWIPAQQQNPAPPSNGGWSDPGSEQTQIRPQ